MPCKHDDSKMQEESQLVGCLACLLQSKQLSGSRLMALTWEVSYGWSPFSREGLPGTRDKLVALISSNTNPACSLG